MGARRTAQVGGNQKGWLIESDKYSDQKIGIIDAGNFGGSTIFISVNNNFKVTDTDHISGSGAVLTLDNTKELILALKISLTELGVDVSDC